MTPDVSPPIRPDAESLKRAEALRKLPAGAHVHVSGICGTGVSAVALLLKDLGFRVTGSDKAFYPPMGDVARSIAEKLYTGYAAENLADRPACVIIGNNLSRGNPEVEHVLANGIPYASMPEAFQALLIGPRDVVGTSVVVSGTHGKTTTSAAIATMLDQAGRCPGYFVGGVPKNLPGNLRVADRNRKAEERIVVLEGDEYDSAFFAKWSKFHSYRPDIAIITSLEFDHADIFESIEAIESEFEGLVEHVPAKGHVLMWDGVTRLKELRSRGQTGLGAPVAYYGTNSASRYRLVQRDVSGIPKPFAQRLSLNLDGEPIEVLTLLSGEHNALNLLVAAAVGKLVGLTGAEIQHGLAQFAGVLRRQNVIGVFHERTLIEDFAHHPTAVAVTLQGLRELDPSQRLVAVFEPRSNTSRRGFFQEEYGKAFGAADVVVIQKVADAGGYSKTTSELKPLDVDRIASDIRASGKDAHVFSTVDEIANYLVDTSKPGDLICCMSNGDFGGLVPLLKKRLGEIFP